MISRSTDIRSALRAKQQGFIMNPSRFGSGGGSGGVFPTSGLLAYYALNDDVTDSSGNARHGTAYSLSYSSDSIAGKSGVFTSSPASAIALPAAVKPSGSFTISMWLKPTTLTPATGVVLIIQDWAASGRNYQLAFFSTNRLEFITGDGSTANNSAISTTGKLSTSNYSHVLVTRSGATASIYVNNVLEATGTGSYSGGTTSNASYIGADNARSDTYSWGGKMDEIGIWSRALDSTERAALYNSGAGLPHP